MSITVSLDSVCATTARETHVWKPVFVHRAAFPKAIPQYEVGFGCFRNWMNQLEANAPGLFLAGHFRDGISLSDSIVSGESAAERLGAFVAGRALTSRLQVQASIAASRSALAETSEDREPELYLK